MGDILTCSQNAATFFSWQYLLKEGGVGWVKMYCKQNDSDWNLKLGLTLSWTKLQSVFLVSEEPLVETSEMRSNREVPGVDWCCPGVSCGCFGLFGFARGCLRLHSSLIQWHKHQWLLLNNMYYIELHVLSRTFKRQIVILNFKITN